MKNFGFLLMLISGLLPAQNFTKQDSLKGSDTSLRNFWDVKKYEISVEPHFEEKSVSGTNKIIFEITKDRIIKAGEKIVQESPESNFEHGFKIFKTCSFGVP